MHGPHPWPAVVALALCARAAAQSAAVAVTDPNGPLSMRYANTENGLEVQVSRNPSFPRELGRYERMWYRPAGSQVWTEMARPRAAVGGGDRFSYVFVRTLGLCSAYEFRVRLSNGAEATQTLRPVEPDIRPLVAGADDVIRVNSISSTRRLSQAEADALNVSPAQRDKAFLILNIASSKRLDYWTPAAMAGQPTGFALFHRLVQCRRLFQSDDGDGEGAMPPLPAAGVIGDRLYLQSDYLLSGCTLRLGATMRVCDRSAVQCCRTVYSDARRRRGADFELSCAIKNLHVQEQCAAARAAANYGCDADCEPDEISYTLIERPVYIAGGNNLFEPNYEGAADRLQIAWRFGADVLARGVVEYRVRTARATLSAGNTALSERAAVRNDTASGRRYVQVDADFGAKDGDDSGDFVVQICALRTYCAGRLDWRSVPKYAVRLAAEYPRSEAVAGAAAAPHSASPLRILTAGVVLGAALMLLD